MYIPETLSYNVVKVRGLYTTPSLIQNLKRMQNF